MPQGFLVKPSNMAIYTFYDPSFTDYSVSMMGYVVLRILLELSVIILLYQL